MTRLARLYTFSCLTLTLGALLGYAAPTAAQDATTEQQGEARDRRTAGLEAITVTARRVEESLQDTPVAVTAFTTRDIQQGSMQLLQDFAYKTPGLRWEPVPTQGNTPTISLRGMSQNDSLITLEGAVGIYFDEIFMGKLQGGNANMMDVERIEVLKGPQGTLYGKNTLGGAINIVSHKPDGTFGGYAKATLGNYDRKDVEGAVQFPILGETLSARVAFQSAFREGFHDFKRVPAGAFGPAGPGFNNNKGSFRGVGEGNENRGLYYRGTLRWQPSDTFQALVTGYIIDQNKAQQSPVTFTALNRANGGAGGFPLLGAGVGQCGVDSRLLNCKFSLENLASPSDKYESYINSSHRDDLYVRGLGGTLTWEIDERTTLKSITAHRDLTGRRRGDSDGTPYDLLSGDNNHKSRQFSQELQLTLSGLLGENLDIVSGWFFFDENAKDRGCSFFNETAFSGFPGFGNIQNCNNIEAQARSHALYSQGTYTITEALRATVGIRYSAEKRWMNNSFLRDGPDMTPATGDEAGDQTDRYDRWTYTAGLDYRFTDDLMLYGKVARGYRSGGFDGRANGFAAFTPFENETITSYELGVKSEWFDNRLRVNIAGFWSQWEDIQLTNLETIPGCPPPCTLRTNAGRARVLGGELEINANPFEGFQFQAGFEVNDMDYKHGPLNDCCFTSASPEVPNPGTELEPQNQPQFTMTLTAIYTFPPLELGTFEVQAGWFHSSKVYGSPTNARFLTQGTYGLLDGRLSLFLDDLGVQVSAFVRNALDREYHYSGVDLLENGFGWGNRTWNAPRTYGVEVTYRFGSDRI